MKRLIFALALLLPFHVQAACRTSDLAGKWTAMGGIEDFGGWVRCTVRINSSGVLTSRNCVLWTGETITGGPPVYYTVSRTCYITGRVDDQSSVFRGRLEPHKRGIIGRTIYDDGVDYLVIQGVIVKRGS